MLYLYLSLSLYIYIRNLRPLHNVRAHQTDLITLHFPLAWDPGSTLKIIEIPTLPQPASWSSKTSPGEASSLQNTSKFRSWKIPQRTFLKNSRHWVGVGIYCVWSTSEHWILWRFHQQSYTKSVSKQSCISHVIQHEQILNSTSKWPPKGTPNPSKITKIYLHSQR